MIAVNNVYVDVHISGYGHTKAQRLPVVGFEKDFMDGRPILWVIDMDGRCVKLETLRPGNAIHLVQP